MSADNYDRFQQAVSGLERYFGSPSGPIIDMLEALEDLNEDQKQGYYISESKQREKLHGLIERILQDTDPNYLQP